MIFYFAEEGYADYIIKQYNMLRFTDKCLIFKGGGNFLLVVENNTVKIAYDFFNTNLPGKNDIFAFIGKSEKEENEEKVFILNTVYNRGKNKYFYPDMVFKHPFLEAGDGVNVYVYGFLPYFEHHNVYFFKISGFINKPNADFINIFKWLDIRSQFALGSEVPVFSEEEKNYIDKFANELRLTETMKTEFIYLAEKYKRRNGNFNIIENFNIPVLLGKKDVKSIYVLLKRKLME